MRKRALSAICLLILIFSMISFPVANAIPVDTGRKCTLTLHYTQNQQGFQDLEIGIYRVASVSSDGYYQLIPPFSDYPVNIYNITSQKEWKDVAATLTAYILSNNIQPDYIVKTDNQGTAVFQNLGTGLYLISGVTAENSSGIYVFEDFMMYLPTPGENNVNIYDMEAAPKCSSFTAYTEYKIVKLWKDSGNSKKRPAAVTVEILKDGNVYGEAITLNSANNWSYSWKTTDSTGKWTVREKDVPEGYTVSVSVSGNCFTITNTYKETPGKVPQTGDIFPVWPYILAMCGSGFLLLILGIYQSKRKLL